MFQNIAVVNFKLKAKIFVMCYTVHTAKRLLFLFKKKKVLGSHSVCHARLPLISNCCYYFSLPYVYIEKCMCFRDSSIHGI